MHKKVDLITDKLGIQLFMVLSLSPDVGFFGSRDIVWHKSVRSMVVITLMVLVPV